MSLIWIRLEVAVMLQGNYCDLTLWMVDENVSVSKTTFNGLASSVMNRGFEVHMFSQLLLSVTGYYLNIKEGNDLFFVI